MAVSFGLKRRFSRVASGHAAVGDGCAVRVDSLKPWVIYKLLDKTELDIYQRLEEEYPHDAAKKFVPEFSGTFEDEGKDGKVTRYICIANLLHDFSDPVVLDVKLGLRTFMEGECQSNKQRRDLYVRMQTMYPDHLEEEHHTQGAITKYHWMTTRDANSTICNLGYRLDGMAGGGPASQSIAAELTSYRKREDTLAGLMFFVRLAATDEGVCDERVSLHIALRLTRRLRELAQACKDSKFVREHEFIGTSVLLVADRQGQASAFWIDFAKTSRVKPDLCITHYEPWVQGNHEDGLFFGLDSLVCTFETLVEMLERELAEDGRHSSSCTADDLGVLSTGTATDPSAAKVRATSDVHILSDLPSFAQVLERWPTLSSRSSASGSPNLFRVFSVRERRSRSTGKDEVDRAMRNCCCPLL